MIRLRRLIDGKTGLPIAINITEQQLAQLRAGFKGLTNLSEQSQQTYDNSPLSTKLCPNCGNTSLILFRSTNEKYCDICDTTITWKLAENQNSLISNNRIKNKS